MNASFRWGVIFFLVIIVATVAACGRRGDLERLPGSGAPKTYPAY